MPYVGTQRVQDETNIGREAYGATEGNSRGRRVARSLVASIAMTAGLFYSADISGASSPEVKILHEGRLKWTCQPHNVFIPEDAPDAVARALEAFDDVSPHEWPLTDQVENAEVVVKMEDPEGPGAADTVHWADESYYRYAELRFDPAIEEEWFYSTALHEWGHIGGLAHVYNFDQVMSSWVSAPIERWTVGDLLGLSLVGRHCRREQLRERQPESTYARTYQLSDLKRYETSEH